MRTETFGKWLRKLRVDHDLKLSDLSDSMHLGSISFISGIERGVKAPSDMFLEILSEKINIADKEMKEAKDLLEEQKLAIKFSKIADPDFTKAVHRLYNNPKKREQVLALARKDKE